MSHGIDIGRKLTLDEIDFLRARGFAFAARYYDGSRGQSAKALSTDEIAALLSRRIGIVPVFETTGTGPFTYDQGKLDGAAARADALAAGQPLGSPICFAIDENVDPVASSSMLVDYLNGIFGGLDGAYLAGLYGSWAVCKWARENAPALGFFWQTYAWSAGAEYAPADVYQHANGVTLRPGLVVDLNIARSSVAWRVA